jgi:hypothetical protein
VIDKNDPKVASRLILILWRAWFIRNELTHSNRCLSISNSVSFLLYYWDTLFTVRQDTVLDSKGKRLVGCVGSRSNDTTSKKRRWEVPELGKIKVNVDGAFMEGGQAGYGVVIRDDKGVVILSAWG